MLAIKNESWGRVSRRTSARQMLAYHFVDEGFSVLVDIDKIVSGHLRFRRSLAMKSLNPDRPYQTLYASCSSRILRRNHLGKSAHADCERWCGLEADIVARMEQCLFSHPLVCGSCQGASL